MDHEPDIDLEDLIPQDKDTKRRREDLISELEYLSGDSYMEDHAEEFSSSFISVDFLKKRAPKSSEEKKPEVKNDDWFSELVEDCKEAEAGASLSKRGKTSDLDELFGGKKKKKKKKKKQGEPTDFRKEFESENALYTSILRDTTRFVDSLQREYDSISSKKGAGRGTTKNVQDLVSNIISARQLATSLVEKKVNLKKLATELSFKEKKELGLGSGEGGNLGEYGSAYLKQLIDQRQMLFNGGSDEIMEIDENDVGSYLDESMSRPVTEEEISMYGKTDRTEEADLYLQYENDNIQVYVSINKDDISDFYYIARDEDGNEIDDYPLPVSKITSTNPSTGMAIDEFGQKYEIEWR